MDSLKDSLTPLFGQANKTLFSPKDIPGAAGCVENCATGKDNLIVIASNSINSLNATNANNDILTPKQTCFLIVIVLAAVNGVLGVIYGYIKYKERKKTRLHGVNSGVSGYDHQVLSSRRKSSVFVPQQSVREKRRKTSTHIILSAKGKTRESLRRMSSNLL